MLIEKVVTQEFLKLDLEPEMMHRWLLSNLLIEMKTPKVLLTEVGQKSKKVLKPMKIKSN